MKNTIKHDELGEIIYEESFWTGKKNITINGTATEKVSKTEFRTANGEKVSIVGNFLAGTKATIGDKSVELTPKIKWYEYILAILPFILIIIWGNVGALCKIVPVVGGAIGGLISGIFSMLSLFVIIRVRQVWLKILIAIAALGLTFLACYLVALIILSIAA